MRGESPRRRSRRVGGLFEGMETFLVSPLSGAFVWRRPRGINTVACGRPGSPRDGCDGHTKGDVTLILREAAVPKGSWLNASRMHASCAGNALSDTQRSSATLGKRQAKPRISCPLDGWLGDETRCWPGLASLKATVACLRGIAPKEAFS